MDSLVQDVPRVIVADEELPGGFGVDLEVVESSKVNELTGTGTARRQYIEEVAPIHVRFAGRADIHHRAADEHLDPAVAVQVGGFPPSGGSTPEGSHRPCGS